MALWEIVGGEDKGGIQVRKGEDINSEGEEQKLSFKALVHELSFNETNGRLNFYLVQGEGPQSGWISVALKSGKVLAVRTQAPAEGEAEAGGYTPQEAPVAEANARPIREYEHPHLIIGAGLGGIGYALESLKLGRTNFVVIDTHEEFGGTTWLEAANATTKLQTEKSTYHAHYLKPDHAPEKELETWPRKHQLLAMFQNSAKEAGLEKYTRFNSHLDGVETIDGGSLNGGHYLTQINDWNGGKDYKFKASAVISWPGSFHEFNEITFEGEKQFGGYITYGSFDMCNYDKVKNQRVMIFGHGGFSIENVRTCLEREAAHATIVCRRRNISGPRVVSWLVSTFPVPIPGNHLIAAMQRMYGLVGVDLWTHPHVQTNKERSFAFVNQGNTFGVSDVYFLAEMHGFMDCRIDNVTKLGPGAIYLEKTEPIEASVILKCLGISPSPEYDRISGVNELVGIWVNGDPCHALMCMPSGVRAKNYGGFSIGPAYAQCTVWVNYFLEYPEDFAAVAEGLPKNKAKGGKPAYYADNAHFLQSNIVLASIPELAKRDAVVGAIKSAKTQKYTPAAEYLAECEAEWKMYDKMMRDHGQIPADTPYQPYPYTAEICDEISQAIVKSIFG